MAHSLTQQVRSFVRVGDNDSAEHPGEFAQHGRDYMICVPLEVGSHDSCEPAACFAKVGSAALLQEQVGHGRFADVTKSVRAAGDSALRRGGGGGEFVAANSSPPVCSAAAVHCGHHPSPRPSLARPTPLSPPHSPLSLLCANLRPRSRATCAPRFRSACRASCARRRERPSSTIGAAAASTRKT